MVAVASDSCLLALLVFCVFVCFLGYFFLQDLDLLCPGSGFEVGYFWYCHGFSCFPLQKKESIKIKSDHVHAHKHFLFLVKTSKLTPIMNCLVRISKRFVCRTEGWEYRKEDGRGHVSLGHLPEVHQTREHSVGI